MRYLQWVILGWLCLSSALWAVTINTTNVPDYPQPPVPPVVEGPVQAVSESASTPTPELTPVEHTVYPVMIEEPEEVEVTETIAFPPDSSNRAMAESTDAAASITLSCNPVEFGGIETKTKVAVVSLDDDFITPIVSHEFIAPWLPPDPGAAGKNTIAGIDSDGDCVRDDIERYIVKLYPGNGDADKRKYLFEYAKWLGAVLGSSLTIAQTKDISKNLDKASYCTRILNGDTAATNQLIDDVFAEYLDTFPRSRRYIQNRSKLFGWSTREDLLQSCP